MKTLAEMVVSEYVADVLEMISLRTLTRIATFLVFACLAGCFSVSNLVSGPQFYGGTRIDVLAISDPHGDDENAIAYYDLPFSAIVDTALLPVTLLVELSRLGFEWPPTDPRLDGRAYPSNAFLEAGATDSAITASGAVPASTKARVSILENELSSVRDLEREVESIRIDLMFAGGAPELHDELHALSSLILKQLAEASIGFRGLRDLVELEEAVACEADRIKIENRVRASAALVTSLSCHSFPKQDFRSIPTKARLLEIGRLREAALDRVINEFAGPPVR